MKNKKPDASKELPAWLDQIAALLAGLTALAGFTRIVALSFSDWDKALNENTLKFFAVAGGLLLLRKVKSISFGDTKVEMQELKERVETLKEDVNELGEETKTTASMAQHLTGASPAEPAADATLMTAAEVSPASVAADKTRTKWNRKPGNASNDPWKGVFGGKAEDRHRRLRAEVVESKGSPDWYRVRVWVESTNPDKYPLTERVRFFLHDEFPNSKPFVPVKGGRAELRLHAYGAFTVGALADDGNTELELDLSEDKSFPKSFREAE